MDRCGACRSDLGDGLDLDQDVRSVERLHADQGRSGRRHPSLHRLTHSCTELAHLDGAAFLAVVTDDFTFHSELDELDATERAAAIDGDVESSGWVAAQTGDAVIAGDGPWYVALPNTISDDMMSPIEGLSVFTIVDDQGTLKLAGHTFVYDF